MPYRKTILANNEIYHILNRSIAQANIFNHYYDYQRALDLINYYRFDKPPLSFSHYKRLSDEDKKKYVGNLKNHKNIVEIIAFCLMPNHCHFLLKQIEDSGISTFMSNFQNSYARYFNAKYKRDGGLFRSMFKAIRIENDYQLLHVSRYIHLNPVTAYLTEVKNLKNYLWSSFPDYVAEKRERHYDFLKPKLILHLQSKKEDYVKFVLNQADYQRELQEIKRQALEN